MDRGIGRSCFASKGRVGGLVDFIGSWNSRRAWTFLWDRSCISAGKMRKLDCAVLALATTLKSLLEDCGAHSEEVSTTWASITPCASRTVVPLPTNVVAETYQDQFEDGGERNQFEDGRDFMGLCGAAPRRRGPAFAFLRLIKDGAAPRRRGRDYSTHDMDVGGVVLYWVDGVVERLARAVPVGARAVAVGVGDLLEGRGRGQ